MSRAQRVKTYLLEEHNEAFLIWNHAIINKDISSENNNLLHIDEHFDMGVPRTNQSILDIRHDKNSLYNYTYNELSLNTFIVPAIFQGIFNSVIWVKNDFPKDSNFRQKRCVRSFNQEGKKLIVFNPSMKPYSNSMDLKKYKVMRCAIENLVFLNNNNVVLDINLSYFFCIKDPSEYRVNYIEITENEYSDFVENSKYHSLKYELLGHRLSVKKENGKFYYVLNDHEEIYSYNKDIPDAILKKNIQDAVSKLRSFKFHPKLITITRSVKSGYLPEGKASLIEEELIRCLKEIYPIDLIPINSIHKEYSYEPVQ